MATDLTLANRYAHKPRADPDGSGHRLPLRSGIAVVTSDEFEGDLANVVTEFEPYEA